VCSRFITTRNCITRARQWIMKISCGAQPHLITTVITNGEIVTQLEASGSTQVIEDLRFFVKRWHTCGILKGSMNYTWKTTS
jgi:hypothetical protein